MSELQVSAKYDYARIDNSANNNLHLMVSMTAPEIVIDDQKRLPLDIAAALDISGSMSGQKLRLMVESFMLFIDNLTANDKISLLAFNSSIHMLTEEPLFATPENKQLLKDKVAKLHAAGGTNIGEALINCFEFLGGPKRVETLIKRAVLFTDGDPTVGVQSYEGLINIVNGRKTDISISTFGYGTDHDPEILGGVAKRGRGNTFFVKKMEDCAEYFGVELGGLLTNYAKDIKILLTPAAGIKITKILNNVDVTVIKNGEEEVIENVPDRIQVLLGQEQQGDQIVIKPDDIYGEETKHILVELDAKSRRQDPELVSIAVVYEEAQTGEKKEVNLTASVEFVSGDQIQSDPDIEIEEQRLLLDSAQAQYTARLAAERGDFQEAQQILGEFGTQMETCACFCSSDSLKAVRSGLSDYETSLSAGSYTRGMATKMSYASSELSRGKVTSKGLYGDAVMESLGSSKTVGDFVSQNFVDNKKEDEQQD